MTTTRDIQKVLKSKPTREGAGVRLNRVFGFSEVPTFDPFLLLDDFGSDNPAHFAKGFPWHPHRGIETITYVLTGEVEHGDSLGNEGVIGPGDVQWMTAGSGIIHQEMPQGDADGTLVGFQLWANLPARQKMMDPRYRGITGDEIPEVAFEDGTVIKVIAGEVSGVKGPVQDVVIDPEYLDVKVPANTTVRYPTARGHTVFAYVIEGEGYFCNEKDPFTYEMEGRNYFDLQREPSITDGELVLFGDGDEITVSTEVEPVRFLLISGKPIEEPVAWYGPVVMNTQDELRTAFEEYREGTFIKTQG